MSLTEKYKWKIAPLIHNFKSVTENIININMIFPPNNCVFLKWNPAEVKTCKGYDFKIWTKSREEKPSLTIERDRLRILSKPSNTVKKNNMQKTSLCQVFMAAISSCITKIDDKKTFWFLIRYARLKLKNYVPSRAKRVSPLFHHQDLFSDWCIHVCLVHKFLSCSPRIALWSLLKYTRSSWGTSDCMT